MRVIRSRFPGKCRQCKTPISVGESVYWTKGIRGVLCLTCGGNSAGSSSGNPKEPMQNRPELSSGTTDTKGREHWSIDWDDLRSITLAAIQGNKVAARDRNQKEIEEAVQGSDWKGYQTEDLDRWLHSGYEVPHLILGEPPVPIREKRRLIFGEEGDEFHYDSAMSGDDNYFSFWTKQESIPGLAVEAEISFAGTVNSSILQAYFSWLCRMIYSLEENGVDCQITLVMTNQNLFRPSDPKTRITGVRVKKEQEISDFRYWSAMISPAALRSLGFVAKSLYADSLGKDVSSGMGSGDMQSKWSVTFDHARRVLKVNVARGGGGYTFPEEQMTQEFHAALAETRKAE